MFTLSSPEFDLPNTYYNSNKSNESINNWKNRLSNLTTFDMMMSYINEEEISAQITETKFNLVNVSVAWSVILQAFANEHRIEIQVPPTSVHEPKKCSLLVNACAEIGVEFLARYWTFDVVLHWLTHGSLSDIGSVVSFLETYAAQHKVKLNRFSQNTRKNNRAYISHEATI